MSLNPNWPVMDYAVCWTAGPSVNPLAQSMWSSVAARTEGTNKITRGKTYELDQVQPGECEFTLRNDDGRFDPANTASPYSGYLVPYRLYRDRAQWPPTVNLLTADQANPGNVTLAPGVLPPFVSNFSHPYPVTVTGTQPNQVYSNTIPNGATSGSDLVSITGWSVDDSLTYAGQCQAQIVGASSTQVVVHFLWFMPNGTFFVAVGPTITLTSSMQTITVAGQPHAGAVGAAINLVLANSPTTGGTLTSTKFQVEIAAAPSAWVQPGTWYSRFTGYVERWPQSWTSGGNYGTVDLTAVDAFDYLANQDMQAAVLAEILVDTPDWFYPLNDPAGTPAFYDLTGQKQPMKPVSYGGAPPGQLVAGTTITDASVAPLGLPGPAVTFTNHGAAGGGCMVLDIATAVGNVGPPNGGNGWTRIFAFRMPAGTSITTQHTLWMACDNGAGNYIVLQVDTSGNVVASIRKAGTVFGPVTAYAGPVNTGSWILVALSMSADGKTLTAWGNNPLSPNTLTNATDMRPAFGPGSVDVIGAAIEPNHAGPVTQGLTADVALAAQLPYDIGTADVISGLSFGFQYLYNAFHGAFRVVESADQRYADILTWARYPGTSAISVGHTTSYGPATDLPGIKTLQALQNVVDTEAGQHFIRGDGTLVFASRADRYNKTPTLTFGEQTGSGELPYLAAIIDYDPTRVANDVQVTEQVNNQLFRRVDGPPNPANNPPKSQDQYGAITLQRTVNSTDPQECDAAAQYFLYQYKQPQQRLEALPVDVAANPSAWPLLLALELGTCVQVNRRPSNAPQISIPGFVEQIVWELGDDLTAKWTGQVSNSALHQFWIVGETRMTLNASVLANATSATVNALADAATNPIAANISAVDPSFGNPEWLIDAGTAVAEFVTITAVPVTTLGYSTAVLTIGLCYDAVTGHANTGFNHAHGANAILQDVGGIWTNIGGSIPSLAALPQIQPANQYDADDIVGSTTIVGY